ncbi:hypothetical protein A8C32_03485 [Flavivirga aquatica]|uniref:Transposase n=1 Tax=Flavivirga aquatica TaxID=1849968 RepID=A0A1E5TB07_9FLAO|nr:hypothetical protein A8C32_03485 [Flavivirga aquatica]
MPRNNYDKEFKTTIVELLNTGKTVQSLSDEYRVSSASINRWKKEFDPKHKTVPKESNESLLKISALEKELKEIKLERDILKKAVSIFSKSDS